MSETEPQFVESKFCLGRMVATSHALQRLTNEEVFNAINRHRTGDWGDVCEEDRHANEQALVECTRLFSVYHSVTGAKFWIITEADRSATTVLMPEDY